MFFFAFGLLFIAIRVSPAVTLSVTLLRITHDV